MKFEGYICCPKVSNVPVGREGWEKTKCPKCKSECWLMPQAIVLIQRGTHKALCTECALITGNKGGLN